MQLNGEQKEADGRTITQIIEEMGLKKVMVAVELNENILPKDQYDTYVPKENDVVEIVQFMGGGSL
ncbi:MAG: sulfur carrier protein ThiS [Lachnospiraceae bacterium]|uniref:Sulfur carrier protein ThiS n=1 Tax=Candidatus Weimeria bifida TaxID=2599074 RepID=A0A6N7J3K5_9FIRM|nr:sulfur carrier protein ThiS [Candidatus Weimeria bifida]RRF97319.1 MAG: sulfur carrier protein ThiS [Lachnospiraceae bacterium]